MVYGENNGKLTLMCFGICFFFFFFSLEQPCFSECNSQAHLISVRKQKGCDRSFKKSVTSTPVAVQHLTSWWLMVTGELSESSISPCFKD